MGARGAAAHPLYGRHAGVKSFALRQLLRCRWLRHLRSADSRLETRGARFRRGNRRAREGEQGRQGATRGWGVVLKGLGCVWRLSAAAKRCRRWMCDPDAAAECLNAASCAARIREGGARLALSRPVRRLLHSRPFSGGLCQRAREQSATLLPCGTRCPSRCLFSLSANLAGVDPSHPHNPSSLTREAPGESPGWSEAQGAGEWPGRAVPEHCPPRLEMQHSVQVS